MHGGWGRVIVRSRISGVARVFTSTDPPCATQEPSGTGMCACDRAISANVLVCGLYRVLMHVGKLGPASGRSPDGVRVFQSLCTLTHTKRANVERHRQVYG